MHAAAEAMSKDEEAERKWLQLYRLLNSILDEDALRILEGAKLQRIQKVDRDSKHTYVDISIKLRL
jgi:hypothetical protein